MNPKVQTWLIRYSLDLLILQVPQELCAVDLVAWKPTKEVSVFEMTYPSEDPVSESNIRTAMLTSRRAKIEASNSMLAFSLTYTPLFFCERS